VNLVVFAGHMHFIRFIALRRVVNPAVQRLWARQLSASRHWRAEPVNDDSVAKMMEESGVMDKLAKSPEALEAIASLGAILKEAGIVLCLCFHPSL
jgi:hypothetical protein